MKHSVIEYKLSNGAKGLVVNVPGAEVVNMAVSIKAGSLFADRAKYEVPHILEHVMFSGAGKFPTSKQFKQEVGKNGARLSATTYKTDILYEYDCVAGEAERILDLLTMQLSDPKLPADSFITEVSNVREELQRNTTNHLNVCSVNLYSLMLPKSFQTEVARLEQLERISRDDAYNYYQASHTPNNLRFFLAGDFSDDGEALVRRFERGIAGLKAGDEFVYPVEDNIKLSEPLLERREIQSLYYNISSLATSSKIDYHQRLALSLASALLTAGWQSWVYGEAREKGLAYHVGSLFKHLPDASQLGFYANVSEGNAKELFGLISTQMQRLKQGDFNDSEIERVRRLVSNSFILGHQTPGSLLDWYYPHYLFDDVIRDPDEHLKQFKLVTVDQVRQAVNKVLDEKRWGVSLVGNISKAKAGELYEVLRPAWE